MKKIDFIKRLKKSLVITITIHLIIAVIKWDLLWMEGMGITGCLLFLALSVFVDTSISIIQIRRGKL